MLIILAPPYVGFSMPLSLVGDSLAFKFGDYMCIGAKASMHICKLRTMNTTYYAKSVVQSEVEVKKGSSNDNQDIIIKTG